MAVHTGQSAVRAADDDVVAVGGDYVHARLLMPALFALAMMLRVSGS